MGEIPQANNILSSNQMKDFVSFKPYLALIRAVKQGNSEEYNQVLIEYKNRSLLMVLHLASKNKTRCH